MLHFLAVILVTLFVTIVVAGWSILLVIWAKAVWRVFHYPHRRH